TEKVSETCSALANMLFPPQIEGYILTGSGDTWINSKPAARAAATAASRQDIEAQEAQAKAEQEEAQRQEDARTFRDVAGEYLEMAGAIALAVNPVTGPVLMSRALHDQLSTEEGRSEMVDGVTHFVSELWQPTVASAAPGSTPTPDDKIDCHKHPSSLTQFLAQKKAAFLDDPLGTALNLLSPDGMLETAFQGVNAVIGSISNLFKGDDEPPAAEYIAEGARDVRINSQPAARSGARCTCEARVVNEPGNGAFVSPDVRIGGPLLVVRDIRSGRSQITLVATVALMFLRPGKMLSKIACFAASVGMSMLAQKATRALPHPVNAATGAKYLADDDDFDFSLPGHFPLDWQRVYSSRDERTEGMFGQGWSVMYEVSLVRTPGNADENCMTFVSGMGRRLDMEAVLPGSGFYSPGEGLAVRRGEQGHWLISSDDGQFFLFEADPHNPQRQRLKMLGDRNSNCLNLYYDDRGRITEISGEQQRPCIRLYYELAAHPRRMTQIYQHFPETAPLLLRRYSYDEAGHLNGVYDSTGHLLREFAYDENHCMTLHRQPGGEGYYYQWGWYDGPDDAAWRVLEIRRRRSDAGETDAPEIIRFSYDRLGRMLSEETAQGILTHQYDELGNRTATTFPDGRTQRHLYYGSGHLQQINLDREVISEFTRDHLHREVLRSQGRLSTRQLYDPGGRLKRRETYSGMRGVVPETFTDRQYSYSGEDELLKTRHSRRGETDYFYDPTGRITACRSEDEGYLASWQYDAAGNMLGRRAGERATAENSVVPFNRLMSYRGVHYRYDEFGRAVEKEGRSGTQSYRYDAEHRMVEVTTARGTYRYVYDALGRRTEKQHISPDGKPYNRTKFLWDGMRLAQESRPEGTDSLYIYRDPGSYEPLARVDKAGKEGPNRILYFHTDVNGAPEEMTDSDGRIVWETGYQVWGNTIQEKDHGRVEQNLRYQGQYLDRETGLHYNLHRYYDPDVGRFMVTDPIGLAGGINLYAYAPNPLGWIDPLGLKCSPEQLAKNRKAGALHEVNTTAALKAKYGQNAVHEQVYIRPLDANGKPVNYRVRLDNVIEHQGPGAKPSLIDAKASSTAPYTHNQKKGYPLISKNGGVIESGPMSGTRVGPTDVIRIEPVDLSRGSY
ncbi:RHS repeat-associated core domain-containing protein, partial [Escherichia coli]|uniref:RHS repeat-associated core domain-containing protein n=4 Tax=Escherichia coli TaxID=562 RepID=UPI00201D13DF